MSEEVFKAWVADRINDKRFEGHWDNTSSGPLGRRGRETTIKGSTGVASISVTKEGNGINEHYIAKITIPVQSVYRRKTFIGIGSEYREEGWSTNYKYHVTYRRGITINRFEEESYSDHSSSPGHDAVQWSHEELKNDIFGRLVSS